MKAAQFSRFGGPEVLEIVDLPNPIPAQDRAHRVSERGHVRGRLVLVID